MQRVQKKQNTIISPSIRVWHTGVVHVDHVANERLYGKPVDPGDILDGKLPPPNSFKQLIDTLNAVEDGRFERHASDADSDISSQGVHTGLDHALVGF